MKYAATFRDTRTLPLTYLAMKHDAPYENYGNITNFN